jgi:hypothetical protein
MPRSKPAAKTARLRDMRAVLTLAAYITPFLLIAFAGKIWLKRKGVELSDLQAEGDPHRPKRSRFLLGIWSHEGRE